MALATQTRRTRTDSRERWNKALARAIANGLEVFIVADTGERMVTSATKLDTLHRTDGYACTCEAGLAGDPVCQHRAAVRFCLGWIHPEPETPAPALAPVEPLPCLWCHGTGMVPNDYAERYDPCDMCGGSGQRPERTPATLPAAA